MTDEHPPGNDQGDARELLRRVARHAPHVCTPLELDALAAYLEHGGRRTAAHALGISEAAFRGRYDNAVRKLRAAILAGELGQEDTAA